MTPEVDGAFIPLHEHQLATLEIDPATGSYTSFLEVAIDGAGVDGVGYLSLKLRRFLPWAVILLTQLQWKLLSH